VSDILKVLGQSDPAATTETVLYTVPDKTQTTISSIVVCNRAGSSGTYRINVSVAGATTGDKEYLFYDKTINANTTDTIVIGITLGQTDELKIYSSSSDFSFSAFGCETLEER